MNKISKILSANDIGTTGSHQAGIFISKNDHILPFFPKLEVTKKNPRAFLDIIDSDGNLWECTFIYYNNKFFGGTRNEYRLTRLQKLFKHYGIKPNDEMILTKNKRNDYEISFTTTTPSRVTSEKLTISNKWRVINI
jgi:hypothetical protein